MQHIHVQNSKVVCCRADPVVHLLLLKSSMERHTSGGLAKKTWILQDSKDPLYDIHYLNTNCYNVYVVSTVERANTDFKNWSRWHEKVQKFVKKRYTSMKPHARIAHHITLHRTTKKKHFSRLGGPFCSTSFGSRCYKTVFAGNLENLYFSLR